MSRLGNFLFFTGFILVALTGILFSAAESDGMPIVLFIGCVAVATMGAGGWLWYSFAPPRAPVTTIVVPPRSTSKVRLLGAIKFIAGASLYGAFLQHMQSAPTSKIHSPGIAEIIALATPGAFALVGLIEFTTGMQFAWFSSRWDSLKPRQRGIMVFLTFFAGLALLFAAMLLYVKPK